MSAAVTKYRLEVNGNHYGGSDSLDELRVSGYEYKTDFPTACVVIIDNATDTIIEEVEL